MSRNTWIMSAIFVVIFGVFVGSVVSDTTLLDFLAESEPTQQVEEVKDSPWAQDGEYLSIELKYFSPAGEENNVVKVMVDEDNTITDFEMTIGTANETSIAYQERFIEELETTLIGMTPEEAADIDTIAGASLTTTAFTDAIRQM